jgi:phospholipid/cholesterol/gamma-HCH transport system permease protein
VATNTRTARPRAAAADAQEQPTADVVRTKDGALVVRLAGPWRLGTALPSSQPIVDALRGTRPPALGFDAARLAAWDSGLLIFLDGLATVCGERDIPVDRSGLPEGVNRLLDLAHAVPSRTGVGGETKSVGLFARAGLTSLAARDSAVAILTFVGEIAIALGRLLRGRARFRAVDLALFVQECGASALPIVTLISFLVGVILAFVGAVQLGQFGAQIYVADLVGLAMVRQMGALMAAIIMAGRTGAAFAAQLGSMKVNEEIDALTTMGIPALDFLVLPRFLAMCLMMPLLCLYANLLGILGGMTVSATALGISLPQYWHETLGAITLKDCLPGLIMSFFFGALVALFGCLRGMQCAGSSSAVGDAATSAVVSGIVSIIVADAIFTVLFNVVGI